jgi:DNA-binding response OmpR family regulator
MSLESKKKILVVDDDADFVESVSLFLEHNNFTVLKARDGSQGLKLARMEQPDLILMDVMMNERTEGFFTVQEMRRTPELAATPIFILSALYETQAGFRVKPQSSWLAHDEFIAKPVDMQALLGKIRARLGAGQAAAFPAEGA